MPVELKNVLRVSDPTGLVYYLGTLTPLEIKSLTFVPVVTKTQLSVDESSWLNEQPEGYQRSGELKRMQAIKKFILEEFTLRQRSCLIPPVLLSARGQWKFTPANKQFENFGTIQANALAAIIDGQHRLGGLLQLAIDPDVKDILKERPIPFMAVDNIEPKTEEREFIDINDNQKGVKKSLTRYLDRDKSFSGMAANALMTDEESVFYGRIDTQKKEDWIIFLFGAVKECIELTFPKKDFTPSTTPFDPYEDETVRTLAIDFVLKYWQTVKDSMPEFWSDMDKMPPLNTKKSKEQPGTSDFRYRLLEETGIRAFSKLAPELFTATWMESQRSPSFENIAKYLEKMANRDRVRRVLTKPKEDPTVLQLDPDLKSTGKAGVTAIFRHLKAEFQQIKI
jgi:DGQHR domain-containing protein